MVPKAGKDLDQPIGKIASPSDLAGYGKAVLHELRVSICVMAKEWVEEEDLLIPPPGEQFWSEHSERNFTSGQAGVLGISQPEIDRLGRWKTKANTSGSDDYMRTGRQIVRKIQKKIIAACVDRHHEELSRLDCFFPAEWHMQFVRHELVANPGVDGITACQQM